MKSFKEIAELDENNLMLVDGLNLAFRYLHAGASDFMEDYMKTVSSLQKSYKCGKVIIACDWGSSSYRKALYPAYKGNREEKRAKQTEEETEAFNVFITEVNNIMEAYAEHPDVLVLRYKGVEADDLIAFIVRYYYKWFSQVWIMSSDKDLDLLVKPNVSRFSYVTRKEITYDNWSDHYPYEPCQHIDIKCLQGDSGDNIPGVPGVGPKKAHSLVEEYGSIIDIHAALPIQSKYKYIQSLNEFGHAGIELNIKLMDLLEHCEEAIGDALPEVTQRVEKYLVRAI